MSNIVEIYKTKPVKYEDLVIGQPLRIIGFYNYDENSRQMSGLNQGDIIYVQVIDHKCTEACAFYCISRTCSIYFTNNKDRLAKKDIDYRQGIWSCYCYLETLDGRKII